MLLSLPQETERGWGYLQICNKASYNSLKSGVNVIAIHVLVYESEISKLEVDIAP
jgi:hypothetical protein